MGVHNFPKVSFANGRTPLAVSHVTNVKDLNSANCFGFRPFDDKDI